MAEAAVGRRSEGEGNPGVAAGGARAVPTAGGMGSWNSRGAAGRRVAEAQAVPGPGPRILAPGWVSSPPGRGSRVLPTLRPILLPAASGAPCLARSARRPAGIAEPPRHRGGPTASQSWVRKRILARTRHRVGRQVSAGTGRDPGGDPCPVLLRAGRPPAPRRVGSPGVLHPSPGPIRVLCCPSQHLSPV